VSERNSASTQRLQLIRGDITALAVDAVVNSANPDLLGGGGVDGAIHRQAGPQLLSFCRELGPCPTGEVRLSPGFCLPARHIIHAVGPVWQGGNRGEPAQLRSCYIHCLRLAEEQNFHTLAFPAISCGVFSYPLADACALSVEVVKAWLGQHAFPRIVYLVAFSQKVENAWARALQET
jgi:O-acetyl-ADP-ribose deacetylase (regulator of RNase III)